MPKPAPFLLPLAIFSALTGIVTGLYRIGWFEMPAASAGEHGAIMVGCFMGTLVSLERAVAFRSGYAFVVPLLSAASLVAFLSNFREVAYVLLIISSIGLTGFTFYFQHQFSTASFIILFTGTVCWLLGNVMLVLWNMYPVAVSWWMAFILFTITSSRLKTVLIEGNTDIKLLSFYVILGLFITGLLMPFHGTGQYWMGIGLICIALWLLINDSARQMITPRGVSRYSGILLICGFMWLLATGVFMLWGELVGPMYDTALHAFFIGFLFSVIMAHGPMILPTLLSLSIKPFHGILYMWFAIMQASLMLRISSNFMHDFTLRKWAGMGNGVAILAFFITMALLVIFELRKAKSAAMVTAISPRNS